MREEDHIFLAMLKDAANYGKNSLKVRKKGGGEGRGREGGKVDLAAVGPQVNYGIDPEPGGTTTPVQDKRQTHGPG